MEDIEGDNSVNELIEKSLLQLNQIKKNKWISSYSDQESSEEEYEEIDENEDENEDEDNGKLSNDEDYRSDGSNDKYHSSYYLPLPLNRTEIYSVDA